jgi:hypothetical protein
MIDMHAAAPAHTRTFTCTQMSVHTQNVRAYVRQEVQTWCGDYKLSLYLCESSETSAESATGPTLNLHET